MSGKQRIAPEVARIINGPVDRKGSLKPWSVSPKFNGVSTEVELMTVLA